MPALSSTRVPSVLRPGPNATLTRKGVVQVSTRQLPSASSSFWLHNELPQCSRLQIPAMLLPGWNVGFIRFICVGDFRSRFDRTILRILDRVYAI